MIFIFAAYSIKLNDDGTPIDGQSLPTKPTDGVVGYKRSSIKDGYADMEFDEFKRRVLEDEDEEDETGTYSLLFISSM